MKLRILFLVGLLAAAPVVSHPQAAPFQAAVKLSASSDSFDPLGILESEDDTPASVKSVAVQKLSLVERSTFDLINQKRVRAGLKELTWNEDLAEVARNHSRDMAEFNFFSHRGLDNKLVSDRADARNLGRWRAIGENIAFNRGFGNPVAHAVDMWLDSVAHRRNMLDAGWRESAIGVAVADDGSYYFTQVFLVRR